MAKAAINRMAFGLAEDLREHGVAAIALTPGFVRTERVEASFAQAAMLDSQELRATESPEYTGRAGASLAADADMMSKSGQTLVARDLAREYGFTDIDGRQPLFQGEP